MSSPETLVEWHYPAAVELRGDRVIVTFPDVPTAAADGDSVEIALERGRYMVMAMLSICRDEGRQLPVPSPADGRPTVVVTAAEIMQAART
jgi:predicted RNase H-like HicB family nuclease